MQQSYTFASRTSQPHNHIRNRRQRNYDRKKLIITKISWWLKSIPPVVRCLPLDDCERNINSVFATRQMPSHPLKTLINFLIQPSTKSDSV